MANLLPKTVIYT